MSKKVKVTTTTITEEIVETQEKIQEKTHIICVLDRSGSMASIIKDSIGGFNSFLKEQKKLPDQATITVALFDDQYELLYDSVDIKKAEEITKEKWIPRGMTALYDAIGKTINTEISKINTMPVIDRPTKILVIIVTDGEENASREYKLDQIKSLIKQREEQKWNFMYLAANQDAFSVGSSFGVSAGNTFNYTASSDGVVKMSQKMSKSAISYRNMNSFDASFSVDSKNLVDDGIIIPNTGVGVTISSNGNSVTVTNAGDVPFTLTTTSDANLDAIDGIIYNTSEDDLK